MTAMPGYKQARRSQIVAAAQALLKAQEYDQIQMRDVADAADVALGTLYRYFSSKEHVYAAVLMDWAQPVSPRRPGHRPRRTPGTEKVRGIIATFERRPAFFKVCMLLQNTADANAAALMEEFGAVAQRTLSEDFASLGAQESADTAIMVWGIINTMLSGALLHGHPIADAYRVVDAFVDLVAPRLPAEQRG